MSVARRYMVRGYGTSRVRREYLSRQTAPSTRVRDSSQAVLDAVAGGKAPTPIRNFLNRTPPSASMQSAFHTSTGLPPATPRSRRPGDASVAGAGLPFCLFPSGFSTPGAESGPRRPVPERRSAAAGGRPAGRAKAARFPDCPEFPPKTAGNGCTIAGSQVRAKEKTLSDGIPPAEPLQRSLLRAYGPPLKASNAASPTFP